VRASELSLQLSAKEVEQTSLRMTPHNSLIFLGNELGTQVVARYVAETYRNQPINGTFPRLRVCPSCQVYIELQRVSELPGACSHTYVFVYRCLHGLISSSGFNQSHAPEQWFLH
jgi:hypothetical protein